MLKLLAISLIAGLLSLGSMPTDTTRAEATKQTDNPITQIAQVFAEPFAETNVVFHYHRSDGEYASWDLWIWGQNEDGQAYTYTGQDDYGKYLFLPLSTFADQTQVNFIIRQGEWTHQTGDINVQFADFELKTDNAYHLYLVNLEETVYSSAEEVTAGRALSAEFTSSNAIDVATNIDTTSYMLRADGAETVEEVTTYTYSGVYTLAEGQFKVKLAGVGPYAGWDNAFGDTTTASTNFEVTAGEYTVTLVMTFDAATNMFVGAATVTPVVAQA